LKRRPSRFEGEEEDQQRQSPGCAVPERAQRRETLTAA
jgi:hypothetical protein